MRRRFRIAFEGLPVFIVSEITDYFLPDGLFASVTAISGYFVNVFFIPLWLLIILVLCLAVGTGFLLNYYRTRQHLEINNELYRKYVNDHILGTFWQWSWQKRRIQTLKPFCPKCSSEVSINNFLANPYEYKSVLKCDNCAFKKEYDIPKSILTKKIQKEIKRRIKTGEYTKQIQ